MGKGQPVKLLIPDVLHDFIEMLEQGGSYALACKNAGIAYSQYRDFMVRAESYIKTGLDYKGKPIDDNDPYIVNYKKIDKAIAKRSFIWLKQLEKASKKSWQAAAWKLERCHFEDFSLKSRDSDKANDSSNEDLNEIKEILQKCMMQKEQT